MSDREEFDTKYQQQFKSGFEGPGNDGIQGIHPTQECTNRPEAVENKLDPDYGCYPNMPEGCVNDLDFATDYGGYVPESVDKE